MATAPTLGSGPVDYTDGNGQQFSIPLSDLQFKNGKIDDTGWSNSAATSDGVLKLLKYLEQQSIISPGPQAPAVPAMILQAATPGSVGNNVQIAVTKVNSDQTFSMTVTETDVYTGLAPAALKAVLGDGVTAGTTPGLVTVSAQAAGNPMPAPSTTEHALTDSGGGVFTLDVQKQGAPPGTSAFTVKAARPSADPLDLGAITVRIDAATVTTFNLVVAWTRSFDNLKPTDVVTKFGYELAVTAPPGGLRTPNVATIGLTGGSEPVGAVTAKATLIATS